MMLARHSHCFSKCQLELIIDGYLGLGPYYQLLLRALATKVHRFEENAEHRSDKPHPVRVYTRDFNCSRNMLDAEGEGCN
jgi:hypothetical protein